MISPALRPEHLHEVQAGLISKASTKQALIVLASRVQSLHSGELARLSTGKQCRNPYTYISFGVLSTFRFLRHGPVDLAPMVELQTKLPT